MFNLGMGEAVTILLVVVLLFGAKKIPALGSSFGKAIKNFKSGLNEDDKKKLEDENDEDKKA